MLNKFVYYYLYGSLIRLPSTITEITALLAKLNRGEKVEMLKNKGKQNKRTLVLLHVIIKNKEHISCR